MLHSFKQMLVILQLFQFKQSVYYYLNSVLEIERIIKEIQHN